MPVVGDARNTVRWIPNSYGAVVEASRSGLTHVMVSAVFAPAEEPFPAELFFCPPGIAEYMEIRSANYEEWYSRRVVGGFLAPPASVAQIFSVSSIECFFVEISCNPGHEALAAQILQERSTITSATIPVFSRYVAEVENHASPDPRSPIVFCVNPVQMLKVLFSGTQLRAIAHGSWSPAKYRLVVDYGHHNTP